MGNYRNMHQPFVGFFPCSLLILIALSVTVCGRQIACNVKLVNKKSQISKVLCNPYRRGCHEVPLKIRPYYWLKISVIVKQLLLYQNQSCTLLWTKTDKRWITYTVAFIGHALVACTHTLQLLRIWLLNIATIAFQARWEQLKNMNFSIAILTLYD